MSKITLEVDYEELKELRRGLRDRLTNLRDEINGMLSDYCKAVSENNLIVKNSLYSQMDYLSEQQEVADKLLKNIRTIMREVRADNE